MKLITIVFLLSLALEHNAAAPMKRHGPKNLGVLRSVFYTNLCRMTSALSKSVGKNIQYMEKKIPQGSRLPRLPFVHMLNMNEEERLTSHVNQLQSFMPRLETAIGVERTIKGQDFLYNLTTLQYKVMNVKSTLRHFMKRLSLPVGKKEHTKTIANKNNTRLETLGMLKDLRITIVLMNYEMNKASKKFKVVNRH